MSHYFIVSTFDIHACENYIIVVQMIILYKDPEGSGLNDTITNTYQKSGSDSKPDGRARAKSIVDFSELEQKVAGLEKTISEQETTIANMKKELELYQQKVSYVQAYYLSRHITCPD